MRRDLVAQSGANVVRVPLEKLSGDARAFLGAVAGGALRIDAGAVSGACGSDSRHLEVPDAVAQELGVALGLEGFIGCLELEARPLPPKPDRRDFAHEVDYFRAAASHHNTVTDILEGE